MDIENLIERLRTEGVITDNITIEISDLELLDDAATALSMLQAENAQLRDELDDMKSALNTTATDRRAIQEKNKEPCVELDRVKQLYESEKEDFIDFACSGVPNLSPYCMNRHPDCVDERGWCRTEKCRSFSRERDPQKED